MNIDLPPEVWRVLHSMMMDDPIPRRAQFQATVAFEAALKAAQDAEPAAKAEAPPA